MPKIPIHCNECGKLLGYMDDNVIYLYCKKCKKEKPTLIRKMIEKAKDILSIH